MHMSTSGPILPRPRPSWARSPAESVLLVSTIPARKGGTEESKAAAARLRLLGSITNVDGADRDG